jgi:O-antigen/teichoic acid export membrane protein
VIDGTQVRSRRAARTALTKGTVFVLGGISSVVVSRALMPQGRGSYAVILSIAQMALSLGHLSLEQAHVFFWQFKEDRDSLIANGILLGFVIGCVVAVAAGLVVHALGQGLIPVASYRLLYLALGAVPFSMMVLYANGFYVLRDDIERINKAALSSAFVSTGTIVVLGYLGHLTLGAVILVTTFAAVFPLFILLPSLKFRARNVRKSLASKAIGLGLRYHIGMAALFLLFRVDIILLNSRVSRAEVGLYSLAVVLAELTYLLTDSIAQVVLPRQLEVSLAEGGHFTARVVRINVIVATAALGLIVAASPVMIPIVFGSAFSGSVASLAALAPGVLALAIIRPVGGFLIRLNRPLTVSFFTSSALIVNVILNLLLIPVWGIVGAAAASSIAYSGLAIAYLSWLVRAGGLHLSELLPKWEDLKRPLQSIRKRVH